MTSQASSRKVSMKPFKFKVNTLRSDLLTIKFLRIVTLF